MPTQRAANPEDRLTIAATCLRLGKSYNPVLRLLLTGQLRGGQDERGRYWVAEESVAEFQRRTGKSGSPQAA